MNVASDADADVAMVLPILPYVKSIIAGAVTARTRCASSISRTVANSSRSCGPPGRHRRRHPGPGGPGRRLLRPSRLRSPCSRSVRSRRRSSPPSPTSRAWTSASACRRGYPWERRGDAIGDEVEGGAALHRSGFALRDASSTKAGNMVRRRVAPPGPSSFSSGHGTRTGRSSSPPIHAPLFAIAASAMPRSMHSRQRRRRRACCRREAQRISSVPRSPSWILESPDRIRRRSHRGRRRRRRL